MRWCKVNMAMHRSNLVALKDMSEEKITTYENMEKVCKELCTQLFASQFYVQAPQLKGVDSAVTHPPVSEMCYAVPRAHEGKARGRDGISMRPLKVGGHYLREVFAKQLTKHIKVGGIPDTSRISKAILLQKKGDKEDFKNYRAISLSSQL